jgi:hypothetical protein
MSSNSDFQGVESVFEENMGSFNELLGATTEQELPRPISVAVARPPVTQDLPSEETLQPIPETKQPYI